MVSKSANFIFKKVGGSSPLLLEVNGYDWFIVPRGGGWEVWKKIKVGGDIHHLFYDKVNSLDAALELMAKGENK